MCRDTSLGTRPAQELQKLFSVETRQSACLSWFTTHQTRVYHIDFPATSLIGKHNRLLTARPCCCGRVQPRTPSTLIHNASPPLRSMPITSGPYRPRLPSRCFSCTAGSVQLLWHPPAWSCYLVRIVYKPLPVWPSLCTFGRHRRVDIDCWSRCLPSEYWMLRCVPSVVEVAQTVSV